MPLQQHLHGCPPCELRYSIFCTGMDSPASRRVHVGTGMDSPHGQHAGMLPSWLAYGTGQTTGQDENNALAAGYAVYRLRGGKLAFGQVCSQVFDKFVRVCDMLSTFFVENLVANLLHQSRRAVVIRF